MPRTSPAMTHQGPSCPASCRASTPLSSRKQDVDAQDKPGHDARQRKRFVRSYNRPHVSAVLRMS